MAQLVSYDFTWTYILAILLIVSYLAYRRYRGSKESKVIQPVARMPSPADIEVLRGCEMVGGTFEYKVKVMNGSDSVINNVTVTLLAYPEDCMRVEGLTTRTLARIEPGGFRSPQFVFTPTKDCVEGEILATVSFLDFTNETQMMRVEPYTIRSVCDLLRPLEASLDQLEMMLHEMTANREERRISTNPEVVFTHASAYLPERNFHIVESASEVDETGFHGIIRCLAEGKYTSKRIAIRLVVSGESDGSSSDVTLEALSDDSSMLPTTIKEIFDGIS
ncbi:MAG: hypothetical protein JSW61_03605 [Candidatus Thorarchaeota archaeon]|nr:MAG: hypothetical protein JSW61_03605 [Candidatus Thorarchaeota archaeon]